MFGQIRQGGGPHLYPCKVPCCRSIQVVSPLSRLPEYTSSWTIQSLSDSFATSSLCFMIHTVLPQKILLFSGQ